MSFADIIKTATWPVSNLVGMVTSTVRAASKTPISDLTCATIVTVQAPDKPPGEGSEQRYAGKPVANTLLDHVVVQSACLWKLAIAATVYQYMDVSAHEHALFIDNHK
jgi:hypothetical protein